MTAYNWRADPKRIAFQASRYKFVAKMLAGKERVLEVGCSDGWGARIVRQHVARVEACDIDARAIGEAMLSSVPEWPIRYFVHDILQAPLRGYDGVYCLDLFEHIADERALLTNLRLTAPVTIIGTPSKESQQYASDISRVGHVNCKSGEELRASCAKFWRHVFMFGMNDETLHTGYLPMCHYLFAVCVA